MTDTIATDDLPRWSTADVHESLSTQSFRDAMERAGADVARLIALFDEHGVRAVEPRPVTTDDGAVADAVIREYNRVLADANPTVATSYAFVSTDSRDDTAQAALGELTALTASVTPLLARLAATTGPQLRLVTSVVIAPLYHPALLAEELATLEPAPGEEADLEDC